MRSPEVGGSMTSALPTFVSSAGCVGATMIHRSASDPGGGKSGGASTAPPDLQLILVLDSRPLEGSPPFLASLRLLPLAFDRRLLVVRSPLHLLEESPLEHHLLEGLQGGFDLVVRHLDLRPGQTRHRPRKCEVERYGRGGSDRSTVFIGSSRRVPSATAMAIVPNTSRDSSTSSPA